MVSVVIPNYNHGRFLRRRIESVLRQTHQHFEVILLDDCSTDDSRSILSEYSNDSRVRTYFNKVNSGSTFKQWNKGVALASGEYVWIAESDDYADEQFLQKLIERLDAEPTAAFAYCRSRRVATDGQSGRYVDSWHNPDRWTADYCVDGCYECRNYFAYCNIVPNASAVVFRKAVYERVGGADESLRLCGDWKVWAAMALTGKVVYVADTLNYFRFHGASVRSSTDGSGRDVAESIWVRWWILDQQTLLECALKDPRAKGTLAKGCIELAFASYPEFPEITCLALQRSRELGGTDHIPAFPTWKGEVLKYLIGWKATKRVNRLYHRYLSQGTIGRWFPAF